MDNDSLPVGRSRGGTLPGSSSTRRPGATWEWPVRRRWGRWLLFGVTVASYGIGSQLALLLIESSGLQGVFFIPAGITVAFLLRLQRRQWWIVLLAAGLTELSVDLSNGLSLTPSLGFAVANVAEPLAGALVVGSACGPLDLARRRDVLWYTAGAVLLGPAVGAAIGAGADRLFGADDWLRTFAQWWLGDALGVVLAGSAILVWGSSRDRRSLISPWGLLLLAGSVLLTALVMGLSDLPLAFSVLIGVVVAAVVFGVRAVAMTALAVALTIAVVLAVDTGSLVIGLDPSDALLLIKLQVAVFTVAGLFIAAESHERELAVATAARSAVEAEALERDRRRDEELAVRVQRGLLPDRVVNRPGVSIAARYDTASDMLEVGGDWYDTIELRDGRIGVVVGDVMGHGIEAMISMGRLRTALTALAIHNESPAVLLSELDEFVGGPDGTSYATVFYAIVDIDRSVLTYASAGHPPGLLISPDGRATWLDQGQAAPLHGEPSDRREASLRIERGSTLVLYSDGLIEQRGEPLEVGLDRLVRHAADLVDLPPETICDRLIDALAGPMHRKDDVVVLATRLGLDEREFYLTLPAIPEELINVRDSVRAWAERRAVPDGVGHDLLISIGEATSNVVRHAYRDSPPGAMTVRISYLDGNLDVEVGDTGSWRVPPEEGSEPGLGTEILRSVTENLAVNGTDLGTVVRFRIPAGASPRRRE